MLNRPYPDPLLEEGRKCQEKCSQCVSAVLQPGSRVPTNVVSGDRYKNPHQPIKGVPKSQMDRSRYHVFPKK